MVETELGEWRRSHYSKELDPSLAESDVTIMGWISSVRSHGNITFLTIVKLWFGVTETNVLKPSKKVEIVFNLLRYTKYFPSLFNPPEVFNILCS